MFHSVGTFVVFVRFLTSTKYKQRQTKKKPYLHPQWLTRVSFQLDCQVGSSELWSFVPTSFTRIGDWKFVLPSMFCWSQNFRVIRDANSKSWFTLLPQWQYYPSSIYCTGMCTPSMGGKGWPGNSPPKIMKLILLDVWAPNKMAKAMIIFHIWLCSVSVNYKGR